MTYLEITIPGLVTGKPRMTRRDKWKQRPCVMRYRAWADTVRASLCNQAERGIPQNPKTPVEVEAFAYIAFPSSYSRKKREELAGTPHLIRPDSDNILKGLVDALWRKSDSHVYDQRCVKRWEDGFGPRVKLHVSW